MCIDLDDLYNLDYSTSSKIMEHEDTVEELKRQRKHDKRYPTDPLNLDQD